VTPYTQVGVDPRVVAARRALEAFNESPAGQALHEACVGPDWKTKMMALDEEIKSRHEAHWENYIRARRIVIIELGLGN
jgi:hypothetical protein